MPRKAKKAISKQKLVSDGYKYLRETEPGPRFYYGIFNSKGERVPGNISVCHAGLASLKDGRVLYTFTPRPGNNKTRNNSVFLEYIDWLISASPWKLAGVVPKMSVKFAAEHGFLIINTKLPANLLANFCVATRQPNEQWHLVERWKDFKDFGVHPNLSFVFAEALGMSDYWKTSTNNHEPLDIDIIPKASVENFVQGKVVLASQPFVQSGSYRPCNTVWGGNDSDPYSQYLDQTYPVEKIKAESRRMFSVPQVNTIEGNVGYGWSQASVSRSREQWKDIALVESKRIFGQ